MFTRCIFFITIFFLSACSTSKKVDNRTLFEIYLAGKKHWPNHELALAGWDPKEVEVSTETNVLLVKSVDKDETDSQEYIHRGVAQRSFARGFNLSDDVNVGEVKFTNGLLSVTLNKVIPDHQKRKVYDIT